MYFVLLELYTIFLPKIFIQGSLLSHDVLLIQRDFGNCFISLCDASKLFHLKLFFNPLLEVIKFGVFDQISGVMNILWQFFRFSISVETTYSSSPRNNLANVFPGWFCRILLPQVFFKHVDLSFLAEKYFFFVSVSLVEVTPSSIEPTSEVLFYFEVLK